jgi:hypothetical protein
LAKVVRYHGKNCAIKGCPTPKKKVTKLYLPIPSHDVDEISCKDILQRFQITKEEKVCGRCRTKIMSLIEQGKRVPAHSVSATPPKDNTKTSSTTGRPRVSYKEASAATKRRMKVSATKTFSEFMNDCNEISCGEGIQMAKDITDKSVLREQDTVQKVNEQKVQKIIEGVSETFNKQCHGSAGRIRLLSAVAPYFKNKELKKAIPCTDYQITEACKHAKLHGPGATPKSEENVKRFKIPPEDLAFVLNFVHHPDNTCRSSHRMASCEGTKSSWISDLFDESKQPVMWLKDGKGNLYKKYKEECVKEGRKPISESKFRDGLNAGNFKEMVRMTGLCNICDDVGAKNWDRFFELTEMLRKETCGETPSTDTMDTLEEDELDDENVDKTKVTIIDITDEDDEYKQHNSLPADSPVLMIEVNEHV